MFDAPRSDGLVPFDGSFVLDHAPTAPPGRVRNSVLRAALEEEVDTLRDLQRRLWAESRTAVLLVFQGMDASGKDSTIRHVLTGVNPAGCRVVSFGPPSSEELAHDFLWRCVSKLPRRGEIGVFNRSWYEEVLVVRVHPERLASQRLPWRPAGETLWQHRLESIRDVERHLARNGTVILKFFLHLSRDEQKRRFIDRIDRPEKNWKFDDADVAERAHWHAYQHAYEQALRATSVPWAPWYAIPADHKPFARLEVAKTLTAALRQLNPTFPTTRDDDRARLAHLRTRLDES